MAQIRESSRSSGTNSGGWLPLALLLFGLVWLLTYLAYQPPAPKPENAPAAEFSAGRARLVLRDLIGDGSPHPVGSTANAAVRERILADFRRLGYAPEVEPGFACSRANCAAVSNVWVRLPGREPGPTLLLSAHYDSVVSGPGAADDLTSVAAMIEIARILKMGPPPRNSVLFLIDDGEEAGLLGARVFAAGPLAQGIPVAINLDARGTSGPSLMFQTGHDNGWLIPILARAVNRPVSSSLFATIYELLPNDTDFTIFQRAGMTGLNYAFIGHPAHYHTPLDNFANASAASLQHQGDNALGVVRGLADSDLHDLHDLRHSRRGKAVFFDLLSRWLFWWPESWALPLAALALLLLVAEAVLLLRQRQISGGALVWGGVAFLAIPFASGLAAIALSSALGAAGAFRANWGANLHAASTAFWLLALAIGGAVSIFIARRGGPGGRTALWTGIWMGWGFLGLLAAWRLPGASFLFLVPLGLAAVAALPFVIAGKPLPGAVSILPAVAAALLWFPIGSFLGDGLGAQGLFAVTLLIAITLTSLVPLFAESGRRLPAILTWMAAAGVLLAAGLALRTPVFSRQTPQAVGIAYHEDADSGVTRWLVFGNLPSPAAMRRAAPLTRQRPFPWSDKGETAEGMPAPGLGLRAPQLTVLADTSVAGKRNLRLQLSSPRGAPKGILIIPKAAGVESITVEGAAVARLPNGSLAADGDWHRVTCSLPAAGVTIDLVLTQTGPVEVYAADMSLSLAAIPSGQALMAARPDTAVTPGDMTLVSRRLKL